MNNWMEGYISDIPYTINYYKEINPESLNMCMVMSGVKPIPIEESFVYIELGCGFGLSTLINAAHYPQGTFYGVDYNPSHIAYAKQMAKEAGLDNVHFMESSFHDIVEDNSTLPKADFITFHGIYAWVNDENRANLVKICDRHLNSGGMVYNSYNAKPGWLIGEGFQKLIHGLSSEYTGSSIGKIDKIFEQVEEILDIDSGFLKIYKNTFKEKIKDLRTKNSSYVVHEYLNDEWRAFFFSQVNNAMAQGAKLTYLCQATLSDIASESKVPVEIQTILTDINDVNNRELIKDLARNVGFRRDIYIRGDYGVMSHQERYIWFKEKRWISLVNREINKFNFSMKGGNKSFEDAPFTTIMKHLKDAPLTTEEIQKQTKLSFPDVMMVLVMLYSASYVAPYQPTAKRAKDLNRVITQRSYDKLNISYICYPHANTAVAQGKITLLWLKAINNGCSTPKELIAYVYNSFTQYGLKLDLKNKSLVGSELKEYLEKQEKVWRKNTLPLWINTGIVQVAKKA